jgi:type II secretory pathway pseudopilin PulG
MDTWVWVVVVIALAAAIAVVGVLVAMRQQQARRSSELRDQFGPEYERALEEHGSRGKADSDLLGRKKRVESLKLRTMSGEERTRFRTSWEQAQGHFVDEPAAAVGEASNLVDEAMKARGFPVSGDFDQRAADISVEHPHVVENYRSARRIALANDNGEANTEDLRQAMVHYRALFTELLNTGGVEDRPAERQPVTNGAAPARESATNGGAPAGDAPRSRTGRRPEDIDARRRRAS